MATKKTATEKSVATTKTNRTLKQILLEKSTWCGLLTIGAALATGGLTSWLNPSTLPFLTAGVGLILTKEGE